jgi:hypothetical protein
VDLNSLKLSTSTTVAIVHPETLEPLGITITLASSESPRVKAMLRERTNKRLQVMAAGRKQKQTAPTIEELESESLDLLVTATTGWSGIEIGDAVLDCNPENVRSIYADPAFAWLKKQVDEAFGDQASFFQK